MRESHSPFPKRSLNFEVAKETSSSLVEYSASMNPADKSSSLLLASIYSLDDSSVVELKEGFFPWRIWFGLGL